MYRLKKYIKEMLPMLSRMRIATHLRVAPLLQIVRSATTLLKPSTQRRERTK